MRTYIEWVSRILFDIYIYIYSTHSYFSFFQEDAKTTFLRHEMNASKEILASETGSKENFIQIGVYFQSFNTKLIYEEPKYQVSNRIIHELVIIRHKNIEEYEI